MTFDPKQHHMLPPRDFEDFQIGESFRVPSRTMAHGFQTLRQAAIGDCPLAHQMGEALIGFLEQSSRFLAPVYEGGTVYPKFEIT